MANTTDSLNLYAKVEDLLENKEAIELLYSFYYDILSQQTFHTLLDVGCGSGAYLQSLQKRFEGVKAKGVDLSSVMVERARAKGVDAQAIDLCELTETYDVLTAVFDMMNYLPKEALEGFFRCVKEHLNEGGVFIFDVNTLFGFEHVAVGAYVVEDERRFLAIDSDFESGVYRADFTLFEAENSCYKKQQESITQYYHPLKRLVKASGMKLVASYELSLYEMDEPDKLLIVLQKQ